MSGPDVTYFVRNKIYPNGQYASATYFVRICTVISICISRIYFKQRFTSNVCEHSPHRLLFAQKRVRKGQQEVYHGFDWIGVLGLWIPNLVSHRLPPKVAIKIKLAQICNGNVFLFSL